MFEAVPRSPVLPATARRSDAPHLIRLDTPQRPPAVITYMSSSGLALARSLGKRGVDVHVVDADAYALGMRSRYCTPHICPDVEASEEDYIAELVRIAESLPLRPVLFSTGDKTTLAISRHREVLGEHYHLNLANEELLSALITKDGLAELANRHGFAAPRTLTPMSVAHLEEASRELEYPVILKPSLSPCWLNPKVFPIVGRYAKVALADDRETLLHLYRQLIEVDPRLIVQEVIPGDDYELYYVCMYCDQNGEPLGIFAGQKVRVFPVHYGSATMVRSFHDPELINLATHMARTLRYQGLGGIELKRDPRDGQYKLIEFNARWGLWDGLSERCGVPLGYMAYLDTIGQTVSPTTSYCTGVIWVDALRDMLAFRAYAQEGLLALPQWLNSLRGPREYSVFSWDDLRPFVDVSRGVGRNLWDKLLSRSGELQQGEPLRPSSRSRRRQAC